MCCLIMALSILGPRAILLIWWATDPSRWERAFDTWIWPALGFLALPWTTLMYVLVKPGGVSGFDWFWIALSVLADLSMYAGNAYKREEVPGYSRYAGGSEV